MTDKCFMEFSYLYAFVLINVHLTTNALHLLVIQTGNAAKVFNMTVLMDEITNSLNSNNNIYCKYYSIQPVIIFKWLQVQTQANK